MWLTARLYSRPAAAADIQPGDLVAFGRRAYGCDVIDEQCNQVYAEHHVRVGVARRRPDGQIQFASDGPGWRRVEDGDLPVLIAYRDRTGRLIHERDLPAAEAAARAATEMDIQPGDEIVYRTTAGRRVFSAAEKVTGKNIRTAHGHNITSAQVEERARNVS